MWIKLLLGSLGVAATGLLVAAVVGHIRNDRQTNRLVEALLADASSSETEAGRRVFRTDDLVGLPAPIQRYLRHVLKEGQPYVQTARMEQSGTFRGTPDAEWSPFRAVHHVTTVPPGFVWDATIDMVPLVPVRVVDAYQAGRGFLRARVGGLVTVSNPAPGAELDEGELLRYLAEAPLYPTAFLPGNGIAWTPIDDRAARATLEHEGTTASLVFHVNDRSEIEGVTGRRSYLKKDGSSEFRPWRGYWRHYDVRNGMRVPLDGEVAWMHPEGEVSYWRGHLEAYDDQSHQADNSDLVGPSVQ